MNGDKITFSGSGDNWNVVYDIVVTNEVEQQTAGKIEYIGDNKAPLTIDYTIIYNNLGQGSVGGKIPLKSGVVKFIDVTCGNCEIIHKDDEIEVEIMWEGKVEKLILTIDK